MYSNSDAEQTESRGKVTNIFSFILIIEKRATVVSVLWVFAKSFYYHLSDNISIIIRTCLKKT